MRILYVLIAVATLVNAFHSEVLASEPTAVQSRVSYEAAIRNFSTSPSYILVSIINIETGQARSVCTTANLLLGAIHREYGLSYDEPNWRKAAEIAIENRDHVFRFHKQAAFENIPRRYSEDELAAARVHLASFSTMELKAKFSLMNRNHLSPTNRHAKAALACVLIERGLSPQSDDRSGQVYIDQ